MMPTPTETEANVPQSIVPQLFRNRNFVSLIAGTWLSVIGDGAYFIVLGWFVLSVTGSQFALGTTLTFAAIPRIVFMLVGGAVADRIDRKLILVVSLLARALVLGLFIGLLVGSDSRPALWLVDVMAVAFGTIDAFFYPANSSIVPTAVPSEVLDRAYSLVQTVQQMSGVMGPLLAAGLLWMRIYPVMFGTIAAFFALSAVFMSLLRLQLRHIDHTDHEGGTLASVGRDVWAGVQYVLSIRILVIVMVVSLGINLLFMGPINIGIPILVKSMGWSGSTYGAYEAGFGTGAVAGGILVSVLRAFRGRFLWLPGLGSVMGFAMAGIGFVSAAWGGIALMGAMGVMVSVVDIPILTFVQATVPADKLGRTMSVITLMSVGLVPVSYTVSSFILQQSRIDVRHLLLICGLAIALMFASLYFSRAFRHIESHPLWQSRGSNTQATL